MSTLDIEATTGDDGLRLGKPQGQGTGWEIGLFDRENRLVSSLTFALEEQARRAHSALRSALNITADNTEPRRDPPHEEIPPTPVEAPEPRPSGVRQWTNALLEEGETESFWGRTIEIFLIVLIVANAVATAMESIPSIYTPYARLFKIFEDASLAIYTAEYLARIWSSVEDPRIAAQGSLRGRLSFALRPLMIVDFLAIVPSLIGQLFFGFDLRALRVFRLLRLLKLARYSQAMQALLSVILAERSALFASSLILLGAVCFFGELMHLAEGSVQPKVLGTMPDGMYWAIVTLATVGYGDIVPITPLGKLITGCTAFMGVVSFALPVGILANGFVTGLNKRRFAITWTMLRRQPLFRGFDTQTLNTILDAPESLIVREHSQVTVAGKEALSFYMIVSGNACVEVGDTSEELGPGAMFGEEALYHSANYTQTVTAETDVRLIAFPGDELRRLCRKYPHLQQRIEQGLARNGRNLAGAADAKRLDELEAENARLRKVLADQLLDRLVPEPPGNAIAGT